jgi:hypothetical protein
MQDMFLDNGLPEAEVRFGLVIVLGNLHLVPKSKNEWSYTSKTTIRLHGEVLSYKKHEENFNFSLKYAKKFRDYVFQSRILFFNFHMP